MKSIRMWLSRCNLAITNNEKFIMNMFNLASKKDFK